MRRKLILTAAAALLATTTLQSGQALALSGNLAGLRDAVPDRSAHVQPVRDGRRAAFALGLGAGVLGGAILSQRYRDRDPYYYDRSYHPRGYYYYPEERYDYYGPPRGYYYDDYGRADDSGHPNRRGR